MNIVDLVNSEIGPVTMGAISQALGASQDNVKRAATAAGPAILAGIISSVNQPKGVEMLSSVLRDQDPSVLENLAGMLASGRQQAFVERGIGFLSTTLGERNLGGLTSALASYAGLSKGAARSLLGVMGPAVLGVLAREQRSSGLAAGGVARLLIDQSDDIARAIPVGLSSLIGSTGVFEGIADRLSVGTRGLTDVADEGVANGKSWMRWAVPVGLVLFGIWAVSRYMDRPSAPIEQAAETVTTGVTTAPAETDAARGLMVGDVDVGRELSLVFTDVTSALREITDAESARAALPALRSASRQLDNVFSLAEQLPEGAQKQLAGWVSDALPGLQKEIDRVNSIAGTSPVLGPVLDPMIEVLSTIASNAP